MLSYDSATQQFRIDAGAYTATAGQLVAEVGASRVSLDPSDAAEGTCLAAQAQLRPDVQTDADGALLVKLTNTSDKPMRLKRVQINFGHEHFGEQMQASGHRYLVHSQWFHPAVGVKPVHEPVAWCNEVDPPSYLVTVVTNNVTGKALLLGALPPFGDGYTRFRPLHAGLDKESAFGMQIEHDCGCTIPASGSVTLSPTVAIGADDANVALEQYRQLMQKRNPREKRPAITGWNSWDYYYGSVRRQDMDANAAACREKLGDRVKYIVVDEGYERQWGEWDAGWKFPQGLADMAAHLKSEGFEPGIWTAPLMMSVHTPTYKYNPSWFARNDDGNINVQMFSYGAMAQLDITHPEVRDHLRKTYTRLRDAGFTYFKCDFAQCVLEATRFHDPSVSHAQIIRKTFELIRQCIGDDAYLLACGAPYESVIGIADSHRISGDIHDYWGQIRQNIRAFHSRWWMHGAAGNVDPDFAIVRCDETTEGPRNETQTAIKPRVLETAWKDGRRMNLQEAKVLLLATYLTGGDIVLGDAIFQLNQAGIDELKRILPPLSAPAVPLNLFSRGGHDTPILLATLEGGQAILACLNLTDDNAEVNLTLPQLSRFTQAADWETNSPTALPTQVTLAPRSARAWRLK